MLIKNNNLIINICEVKIRSTHGAAFPELAAIYSSLSRIGWDSSSSTLDGGSLYKNKLSLTYPGLSSAQFNELDALIRGLYEIQVKTSEGEIYGLAGLDNPMSAEMDFNDGKTKIKFEHSAIEPIQYLGNQSEANPQIGFPYDFTFTLS